MLIRQFFTVLFATTATNMTGNHRFVVGNVLRKSVVVDTDVGLDDLFALCLLFGRQDVDVKLVTTVGGMTTPEVGARTVRRLLAAFGRSDDVPVVAGRTGRYTIADASEWGRDFAATYPEKLERLGLPPPLEDVVDGSDDAVRHLAEILSSEGSESPPTLLCLGPLSNVAAAISSSSFSPLRKVDAVLMGGAVRCAGNSGPGNEAEFNFWADPVATHDVFSERGREHFRSILMADLSTANEDSCATVKDFLVGPPMFDEADNESKITRITSLELLRSLVDLEPSCSGYDTIATAGFLSDDVLSETEEVRVRVDPETGATTEANANEDDAVVVRLGTKVDAQALLRVLEGSIVARQQCDKEGKC